MEEVQKYCDKIVYLKDGELLYAGALDKFFEQQESKDLFRNIFKNFRR